MPLPEHSPHLGAAPEPSPAGPPGPAVDRPVVVYLAGFGRSGSTLVERMLGAAPGWTNVGELVDLARAVARADELCGCGARFSRCPVWTSVGELAFGGWSDEVLDRLVGLHRAAARQRHLPRMLARGVPSDQLTNLRTAYDRIYRAVAEVTGAHVVVDASKGPALGQALAGSPDLDVRVLNVVRDPRAVAWSWNREVTRPHATDGEARMWRIAAPRAAAQWSALQLEVQAIAGIGGPRSARIRYEDFVADPVRTLVSATTDLGVPLSADDLPAVHGGALRLGPSHGLSGNPSRFRSGEIPLRRDDSWTREMPLGSRRVVTALTLPLLAAYGYPATQRRPRPTTPRPGERDRTRDPR
jgi:Sulfotransferase family